MFFTELGNKGFTYYGSSEPGTGVTNSGPFIDLQNTLYWFDGTERDSAQVYYFDTSAGDQSYHQKNVKMIGWAVLSGSPNTVQNPPTIWLIGIGFYVWRLVGSKNRHKKQKP